MTEADVREPCVKLLRDSLPGATIFRLEDKFAAGVPDMVIDYATLTSWGEFKLSDPKRYPKPPHVRSRGLQTVRMLQVRHGYFVVYALRYGSSDSRSTLIVSPREYHAATLAERPFETVHYVPGFDHQFVVKYIDRLHRGIKP